MNWKRIALSFFVILFVLGACQAPQESIESVIISQAEMKAFADSFFSMKIDEYNIPGLVFIFVENGDVLYSQSYGYADLQGLVPLDADSTVMRIGSVSKSFVATAVMQLVERGMLDLHQDINQYLEAFQINYTFSKPVTLAHLLTHTAGFEDPPYVSNTDPSKVQSLDKYLAENFPPPKYAPGDEFIYSNYGYALAGLIVEKVSGIPFDQYVEQNIFQPLDMTHSSYLLAPPIPSNLATGYSYQEVEQIPQPVDYDSDYPGGSIISTAEEMSHFMLAHLQDGCYESSCILMSETLVEMHTPQAKTPYEDQNVAYGFVEGVERGVRLIGHSGAIRGFGNSLNLLPSYDMGYFISFNAECYETSACQIISDFRQELIDRFMYKE